MTIQKYNYNRQLLPAAPFVYLTLSTIDFTEFEDIPAQVDSGADRTLVPIELISKLNFLVSDEISLIGFSGAGITSAKTYLAHLAFKGFDPKQIEVVGVTDEDFAILGRDFLNHYKVTLDGPNLTLTIEPGQ